MASNQSKIAIALTLTMFACACSQTPKPEGAGKSEQLLAAQGPWEPVEDKIGPPNPLEQHMKAREMVNPASSDNAAYTMKAVPPNLESMHFRVLKLERQMAGLQEDVNKLLPPLSNLNSELDMAVSEIQARQKRAATEDMTVVANGAALTPSDMAAPPVQTLETTKPLPIAPPPPPMQPNVKVGSAPLVQNAKPAALPVVPGPKPVIAPKPAMPVPAASGSVTGVRVGEHPDKTRLVLDISAPAKFSTDLDNNEHLLLIDLPETAWGADMKKVFKNPLIRAYSVQKNGTGSTLAIELLQPAKIITSTLLGPAGSGNRIVLDLAPL